MSTIFAYTALDRSGKRTTGTIPAETRAAAMDAVDRLGLTPLDLKESAGRATAATRSGKPVRVPAKAVEGFTRELANLLSAGLSLSRALALLKREASHAGAKHVWSQIHDDVVGGEPLADAMSKWPQAFGEVYIAMVRAGETGGFLPIVLSQIGEFRQREQDLKGKVKAALVYPVALLVIGSGVMVFLLTFFIPRFKTIFEGFGGDLPLITRIVVGLSEGLAKYGLVLLVLIVAGVYFGKKAVESDAGRRKMEQLLLRVPFLGTLIARLALVRFSRMLGTLVGAGVPLVASLKVAKASLGSRTFSDSVAHAIEEVQRGTPLSRALADDPILFPASVVEMISVSEETGRLDDELVRLSTSYEHDLDRNLRMVVSLAEPALLLVMAALIGTVVVSMLLPLFSLQDMMR